MEKVQRLIFILIFVFNLDRNSFGQECGRPLGNSKLVGKIVGGYDIGYYKYPWFVSLVLDDTAWCGGTLVGPKTVITAAHCFKTYLKQNNSKLEDVFTAKLGIYNNCMSESTQKTYKIVKVDVHEKYMTFDPYYDIAVLQLANEATGFEPACLPPTALEDTTRGRDAIAIGLGTIKSNTDAYPCNVREGRILLYPYKTCKSMIINATDDKPDYKFVNAFCAGYMEGGVDACQGDSGGPVLILGPNSREVLIGITSFGYDCAKKNLLGIYTDVSHYLDWIHQKSGVKSNLIATTIIPPISGLLDKPAIIPPISGQLDKPTIIPPLLHPSDKPSIPFNISELNPVTDPSDNLPPMVYTPPGLPLINAKWPPKRIIIEYKRKKPHRHKKGPHKVIITYKNRSKNYKNKLKSNKKQHLKYNNNTL